MIVPHNYGRFYGNIINDVSGFQAWWKTVATAFKDNDKVIFDTNNEYHDMDQKLVVRLNQAAINGIRAAGATNQSINVEGNSWTGAWTWVSKSQNGATMQSLTDPSNKIVYQMHQYLDTDGSGTHAECVSSTIGVERLRSATAWLKQHKKVAILGEFAGGNNEQCKAAIRGMLKHLQDNSDVWKGWLWWASGPWWKDYMFSLDPTTGKAYAPYMNLIMQYT
jgi:endoglucanase